MATITNQLLAYAEQLSRLLANHTAIAGSSTGHLGYESLLVLFFIFTVVLVSLTLGRSRMIVALVSIYVALVIKNQTLFLNLQITTLIGNRPEFWINIGLFIIIYCCAFLALSKILARNHITPRESTLVMVLPLVLLEGGLLASILLPYLPESSLRVIPGQLLPYITTKNAQLAWAALPLFALLLTKAKKRNA